MAELHSTTTPQTEITITDTQPSKNNEPVSTLQVVHDEVHENRQGFNNRLSFLLANIGAAIGFGNFFRFPYLVYQNGGGAFLIPYVVAMFCIGIPLTLLELTMGQLFRASAIKAMQSVHKRLGGVGASAALFGSFTISSYYSVIMAWVFAYVFNTFTWELPWSSESSYGIGPERFFYENILHKTDHPLEFTGVSWIVLISLIIVWIVVWLCMIRGVSSTSLVHIITVPLPFLLLFILLIRAAFLEGAWTGVIYYLKPDFSKLLDATIWLSAAGQIFFSYGLASGILTAYGSFANPNQDTVVDTYIICISNSLFGIFAGFVVFMILGHMAHLKGVTVDEVTTSGFGLAFIAFPEAISLLPLPHLFAFLLWITMFTLGIDSLFGLIDACVSILHDRFPKIPIALLTGMVCFCSCCMGLIYTLNNGFFFIDIVDHYVSNFCLTAIGILECVGVAYCYASQSLISRVKQVPLQYDTTWKRIYHTIDTIVFHSIDEYRLQAKTFSKFGPFKDWALLIKFFIPAFLLFLWILNFVMEIIHPYSSVDPSTFDYAALVIGPCIVILCFGIMLTFCFLGPKHRRVPQGGIATGVYIYREQLKDDEEGEQTKAEADAQFAFNAAALDKIVESPIHSMEQDPKQDTPKQQELTSIT